MLNEIFIFKMKKQKTKNPVLASSSVDTYFSSSSPLHWFAHFPEAPVFPLSDAGSAQLSAFIGAIYV